MLGNAQSYLEMLRYAKRYSEIVEIVKLEGLGLKSLKPHFLLDKSMMP